MVTMKKVSEAVRQFVSPFDQINKQKLRFQRDQYFQLFPNFRLWMFLFLKLQVTAQRETNKQNGWS